MECNRFTKLKVIFGLGLGGTLFAGYLTFFKALTGSCALGESCPYVLGLPACVYGFVMFLSMAAVAGYAFIRKLADSWPERAIQLIAIGGTLFAGWLTYVDVGPWLQSGGSYALYLPSCVYGLVFYILILILSSVLVAKAKKGGADEGESPKKDEPEMTAEPEQAKEEAPVEEEAKSPETELPEMLRGESSETPDLDKGGEDKGN